MQFQSTCRHNAYNKLYSEGAGHRLSSALGPRKTALSKRRKNLAARLHSSRATALERARAAPDTRAISRMRGSSLRGSSFFAYAHTWGITYTHTPTGLLFRRLVYTSTRACVTVITGLAVFSDRGAFVFLWLIKPRVRSVRFYFSRAVPDL